MRLRFALSAAALLLASFGIAQDTVQLVHDLPQLHVGTLNEFDNRYLILRTSGEREVPKLFPRDSVALVRFGDGRLYMYSDGKPVRVMRQEIVPPTQLRVRNKLFGDSFYDGNLEVPRVAFNYKFSSSPELLEQFQSARTLRGFGKVLAVPASLMLGLTTYALVRRDLDIRPQFALTTGIVLGGALIFSKVGDVNQKRALDRFNATL